MSKVRGIYDKVLAGDPITDKELDIAEPFFSRLSGDLAACGPVFQLAFKEAHRVYSMLYNFQEARKREAVAKELRFQEAHRPASAQAGPQLSRTLQLNLPRRCSTQG